MKAAGPCRRSSKRQAASGRSSRNATTGLAATEHGGSDAAAALIRTGRIALFLDGLDGLDEMPPAVQGMAFVSHHERLQRGVPIILAGFDPL